MGDTTSPLRFLLEDSYRAGQTVAVEIQNVGVATYVFNPYYQACEMAYRDGSGRTFEIPPGTHCDLITEDFITPGETVTLFTWNLDECIVDRWGCVQAEALPPGAYTIRGEFESTDGGSAVAQKTIFITAEEGNPGLLAVALGGFGALVAAGIAAVVMLARWAVKPRDPSSGRP